MYRCQFLTCVLMRLLTLTRTLTLTLSQIPKLILTLAQPITSADFHDILCIFTELHQTRSSDDSSVCPTSFCQTHALWQNRRKICPQMFIPYERSFSLVSWEEDWLVGVAPSTWNFCQLAPIGVKSPILNRYSLLVPQP